MVIVIDFPVSQGRQLCKIGTRGRRHPSHELGAGRSQPGSQDGCPNQQGKRRATPPAGG